MMFKESHPKVNEQMHVLSAQSDAPQFKLCGVERLGFLVFKRAIV